MVQPSKTCIGTLPPVAAMALAIRGPAALTAVMSAPHQALAITAPDQATASQILAARPARAMRDGGHPCSNIKASGFLHQILSASLMTYKADNMALTRINLRDSRASLTKGR
jgi:hypothetical protein